ncbi:MAG: chemotaxis protein CheW [Candidatus Desulforudis sp.]|nr:chemotaxis protein CheW [Desulforudis sp.]
MASTTGEQLVIFDLSGQKYAIPVLNTQEIIKMVDVTPIPRSDHFIEGVINLRGRIVPIINLNKRLKLERSETTRDTRIIVVVHNETSVGMIVDRVDEVGRYSPDEIERPESVMKENEYIDGVIKKEGALWLLLQLEKILPQTRVC